MMAFQLQPVEIEEMQQDLTYYVDGVYPDKLCLISREGKIVAALLGAGLIVKLLQTRIGYLKGVDEHLKGLWN